MALCSLIAVKAAATIKSLLIHFNYYIYIAVRELREREERMSIIFIVVIVKSLRNRYINNNNNRHKYTRTPLIQESRGRQEPELEVIHVKEFRFIIETWCWLVDFLCKIFSSGHIYNHRTCHIQSSELRPRNLSRYRNWFGEVFLEFWKHGNLYFCTQFNVISRVWKNIPRVWIREVRVCIWVTKIGNDSKEKSKTMERSTVGKNTLWNKVSLITMI